MTGIERWDIDELFAFIKTCRPYRKLPRRQFDLVLEMLAGRYADTRIRELKPRVSLDRIDNTVHGREGVLRLIYLSGGTIPDRGYYDLRVAETQSKIGELDEEFVWERSVGDTFTLGTQVWRIRKVTHNDVEVVPVDAKPGIFPFWRAEEMNRDFHFSERIMLFLEEFNSRLDAPSLKEELRRDYSLDETAADELIGHLKRQREATGTDLPHRRHLLIEHFDDPLNTSDRKQVILHTLWGGRINRPFSLALQAAWEEKYNYHLETFVNNDCILLMLPHAFSAGELLTLVTPENIERLLRRTIETSGFFGARFRENAGRALLLPRADFKRRLPLWLNRLRAKKLMDAVLPYPDFPILLETWRTCLQDEFDLENLKRLLDEIVSGQIRVTEATTAAASPFADGLIWKQTNTHMYEDDTPVSGKASRLSQELIHEVLFSNRLRPRIPPATHRSAHGETPADGAGIRPPVGGGSSGLDQGAARHPGGRVAGADPSDGARPRDGGQRNGGIDPGEDRLHQTAGGDCNRGVRRGKSRPHRRGVPDAARGTRRSGSPLRRAPGRQDNRSCREPPSEAFASPLGDTGGKPPPGAPPAVALLLRTSPEGIPHGAPRPRRTPPR